MNATPETLELNPTEFPLQRKWRAYWIQPPEELQNFQKCGCSKERYLLREEFYSEAVQGLSLFISAGGFYELYINGERVCKGPPSSQSYWKCYDEIDVSAYLKPGDNCFAIILHEQWNESPGLLLELVDAEGELVLWSDSQWRTSNQTGWRGEDTYHGLLNTECQEIYDARLQPEGWKTAGFDDLDWPEAVFKSYANELPWYRMVPRDIALLKDVPSLPHKIVCVEEGQEIECRDAKESLSRVLSAAGQPIKYSLAENVESLLVDAGVAHFRSSLYHLEDRAFDGIWAPSVLVDFGKTRVGHFEIDIQGPAGAVVEIGYVERLLDGQFNNVIEVPLADRYTLKEGRQTFHFTLLKTFRFVKLRFLQCRETVTLHAVRALEVGDSK